MPRPRLKKGDITLNQILQLSQELYRGQDVDNKRWRAGIDVIGARRIQRSNLTYDRSEKKWVQIGREVHFVFNVRTQPKSYKKTDTIKTHRYPIHILIKDFDKGMDSPFRWRSGSFRKPMFPKRKIGDVKEHYETKIGREKRKLNRVKNKQIIEKTKGTIKKLKEKREKEIEDVRAENLKITNMNIKRGIQLQFFFDLMDVLDIWGLLFGRNTTNHQIPRIRNPKLYPYYDKHTYFVITRWLRHHLKKEKGF